MKGAILSAIAGWFCDTFEAKLLDVTGCKVTFAVLAVEAKPPSHES